ncbi:hypothetical protein [Luteibacter yeojuensis]|uniref:Uncharacterized protein n=1 Tax=Luteibacter yeojuensis TaxID=345309 RepID=A0A7X5QSL9_9GAMM|nr:hypothetical protein [Luteibacter yeojuensis]NID14676.1 hypothetical protein [Luteibacter yeojuensis]
MSSPASHSQADRKTVPASTSPRFLTAAESSAWLATRGLAEGPVPGTPGTCFFQFAPRPTFVGLRELFTVLLDDAGPFRGGLLRFDGWQWDGGCESDPTASYRRGRGDWRSLRQAPGFVFGADESAEVADLLALVVERRWSASFYASSKVATWRLRDGNRVDVFAANLGVERRMQHRLVRLGAVLFIP